MNRIQFDKPNLKELSKKFAVVDLHFHSRYSDGKNSVREIARRAKELNIGIAITDHNDIKAAVEIDRFKDILSIPGIEITSQEGTHILIYFYDIKSLKNFFEIHVKPFLGNRVMSSISLDIEEIVRRARLFKSIVISPHPYSSAYIGICNSFFSLGQQQRLFELMDGVEAINSENLKKWNLKCALLGFNLNKTVTGGSDGHSLYQIGRVVTYASCKRDRKAFLDAVKSKKTKVIGKEIDLFRKVKSNGHKLKTNLKNYPNLVEKNFKYSYTVLNSKSKILRENIKQRINKKVK
jgi:predicted metal-dependent phosphoesterase TrpH